jgi:nucleoside-diphosphate-sugar epimerase
MKRVLITGKNSYVGKSVGEFLMQEPDKYYVETISLKDPNWKDFDFTDFDVVFHVAGIAHVSSKKNMAELYFKVNRDLAVSVANKSKISGVKQFIFTSSMIVYNSKETRVTRETKPNPNNFYGQSKLLAEMEITKLNDSNFAVTILRSPMIYGKNSKGNFPKLIKIAKKTFIFPSYLNKRSMLYIKNLNVFVKKVIDDSISGILFPQNKEFSSTMQIIKMIAEVNNRKILFTNIGNPILNLLNKRILILNKVFGDFYYDFSQDILDNFISLKESIIEIESVKENE